MGASVRFGPAAGPTNRHANDARRPYLYALTLSQEALLGGLAATCGLRVLVAYGLGVVAGVGYPAIWLAWLSDWLMRSALFVWRFRSGRWVQTRV